MDSSSSMAKWLRKSWQDFRVVKLAALIISTVVTQKRGHGHNFVFMIPNTGIGPGFGGHGMHYGCDYWH